MAYLFVAQERRRKPRNFKVPRRLIQHIPDEELIRKYRFPPDVIQTFIGGYVRAGYANNTARSHAVPPETEVLIGLRWIAHGGHLDYVADIHNVSKPTVSRILKKVSSYFAGTAKDHIGYPNNRDELAAIATDIMTMRNFPCCIGAVDGTHINILAPKEDEWAYVNRKGNHSINVQLIADKDLIVRDVVAKWPGATHDAFILRNSGICERFSRGDFRGYWLLGDSGYPCLPWLLTPLLNPTSAAERRYQDSHLHTRSLVERTIGMLKARFRCLHVTSGIIQLKLETTVNMIVSCCVLHNIARRRRLPDPEVEEEDNNPIEHHENQAGNGIARRQLIDNYFANL